MKSKKTRYEVRPEYVRKLMRMAKDKNIKIGTASDFRKRYGMK